MRTPLFFLLSAVGLLTLAGTAAAQNLYRHVDANGRVTFSDRAPAAGSTPAGAAVSPSARGGEASSALPYALRQTMQRYPVTLYTREACEPCASGRTLLQTRGIPFQELTVSSAQDNSALERLSGESSLPLLTIGSQQIKGFSDTEWTRYLDAAGYAGSVQLPSGYRNPAARPLVAVDAQPAASQAAPPPAPTRRTAAERPAPAAPSNAITPDNPTGIRF